MSKSETAPQEPKRLRSTKAEAAAMVALLGRLEALDADRERVAKVAVEVINEAAHRLALDGFRVTFDRATSEWVAQAAEPPG